MREMKRGSLVVLGLCMALLAVSGTQTSRATTSKSPSYEVSEAEFGAGAALETCSGSYCAKASIGNVASGESSSENFSASFSELADEEEPVLEMFVEPGESDLGQLDIDRTATRTMRLHVRSHLAGGYTVQVVGDPPRFEGHRLLAPEMPTPSLMGSEQFALNVVANTSPAFGEDPLFLPEQEKAEGVVVPKYGTPDMFAYTNGDVVAKTSSESSQIRYTFSMIVNVSGKTPAGHYSGDFSAIVTPVF